jgi:hypothetical protein
MDIKEIGINTRNLVDSAQDTDFGEHLSRFRGRRLVSEPLSAVSVDY